MVDYFLRSISQRSGDLSNEEDGESEDSKGEHNESPPFEPLLPSPISKPDFPIRTKFFGKRNNTTSITIAPNRVGGSVPVMPNSFTNKSAKYTDTMKPPTTNWAADFRTLPGAFEYQSPAPNPRSSPRQCRTVRSIIHKVDIGCPRWRLGPAKASRCIVVGLQKR
jgi:hypothetical protein